MVSILVVLDDALVHLSHAVLLQLISVSILVVLDDALVRDNGEHMLIMHEQVSILVVLDDALVPCIRSNNVLLCLWRSLNPCCAGRCSSTFCS